MKDIVPFHNWTLYTGVSSLLFRLPAMDVSLFSAAEGEKGVYFYGVEWPLPVWASPLLPRKGLKPERKYTVKYFKATERCKELHSEHPCVHHPAKEINPYEYSWSHYAHPIPHPIISPSRCKSLAFLIHACVPKQKNCVILQFLDCLRRILLYRCRYRYRHRYWDRYSFATCLFVFEFYPCG